jgi:hypothetical protein
MNVSEIRGKQIDIVSALNDQVYSITKLGEQIGRNRGLCSGWWLLLLPSRRGPWNRPFVSVQTHAVRQRGG